MANKVSIIVRTRDRVALLKRAIKSITMQNFYDWEIIVVNNGGDLYIIKEMLSGFSNYINRINLVSITKPLGMEAATNLGIKKSTGEYITLLDDDDTWEQDFLRKCVAILDLYPDVGGVVTQTSLITEEFISDKFMQLDKRPFNPKLNKIVFNNLAKHNLYTTNAFMYRRCLLEGIGLYREDLLVLGDWEFNIRFNLMNKTFVISETLANYHKRLGNNISGSLSNSSLNLHFKYDTLIRKEYLKLGVKNLKLFYFGIKIYVLGIIINVKRFGLLRYFRELQKRNFKDA